MEQYQAIIQTIALAGGLAWASGINLYAVLLVLGLGGATGHIELPPHLSVLANPLVIVAAGIMYCVEFLADKVPGVDTFWDILHTFIRLPAGAMLTAASVGEISPILVVVAGILGGGMTASSHVAKASARMVINTSPEPFSNWGMSLSEDVLVFAGLWTALNHPVLFLVLLALFILLLFWMLPKMWQMIASMLLKVGQMVGLIKVSEDATGGEKLAAFRAASRPLTHTELLTALERLQKLRESGALSEPEFAKQKQLLLEA